MSISEKEFCDNLTSEQMIEFLAQSNEQMKECVLPAFSDDAAVVEFEHFMSLPGNLHISALTLYRKASTVMRSIKKVTIYESERYMELVMTVKEYENELSDHDLKFIFN